MLIAALVLAQAVAVSDTPEIPMVEPLENLCPSPTGRTLVTIPGVPPSDPISGEERRKLIDQLLVEGLGQARRLPPSRPAPLSRLSEPVYVPGSDPNLAYRHPFMVGVPQATIVLNPEDGTPELSCEDPNIPRTIPVAPE